jgi:hypothetical protein
MQNLLVSSSATEEFKSDVARYLSGDRPERVKVETYVPRVKVQRVLSQLLAAETSLEIDQVVIRGMSGCSDFVGSVEVHTRSGSHVFDFVWCCRWRAETEGYLDYFGFPDQMRAAQEFDWQCFRRWERRAAEAN